MNDTDTRLWHPWLRINRVLCVMLHTRWSAEAQAPVRDAVYTPTFVITGGPKAGTVIQNKGRFVTEDRQKHIVVKTQHPDLDVRFVFSRSKDRISKRTDSVTYAVWRERHGFKYADKSVPAAWIEELRRGE